MKLDTIQVGDNFFQVVAGDIYQSCDEFSANAVVDVATKSNIEVFNNAIMLSNELFAFVNIHGEISKIKLSEIEPQSDSGVWVKCFLHSYSSSVSSQYRERIEVIQSDI